MRKGNTSDMTITRNHKGKNPSRSPTPGHRIMVGRSQSTLPWFMTTGQPHSLHTGNCSTYKNKNIMQTNGNNPKRILLDHVWRFGWRVVLVLLAILGVYHIVLRCTFKARHRNETPEYHAWNGHIGYGYKDSETLYLYDLDKREKLSRDWAWISDVPAYPDSLAVFCEKTRTRVRKGLRGYFNASTGDVVIEPRFKRAWVFSEGLGAASGNGNLVGFIGADGQYVLPPKYPYTEGLDYVFRDGYCTVPDLPTTPGGQCKIGFIDRTGAWAVPPQFDKVRHTDARAYLVKKDGKYGMIDHQLNWLFPPEYDRLFVFSASERIVCAAKGSVQQLLTFDGEVVEPFLFDSMDILRYETDDESGFCISGYLWFSAAGKMGILDAHDGKVIIPAMFDYVDMVSPELFKCTVMDDSYEYHHILYDTKGRPLGEKLLKETEGKE